MQECITLAVFTVVAYLMFGQTLKWNNLVSYAFIIGAVYFAFRGQKTEEELSLPEEEHEAGQAANTGPR